MAAATTFREENATDQTTPLLEGAYLVTHTSPYFASSFNRELSVSHLPRESVVLPSLKMVVAATETCRHIASLCTYVYGVGLTGRQQLERHARCKQLCEILERQKILNRMVACFSSVPYVLNAEKNYKKRFDTSTFYYAAQSTFC